MHVEARKSACWLSIDARAGGARLNYGRSKPAPVPARAAHVTFTASFPCVRPRSASSLSVVDQQELFGSLWRAPLVWLMLNVLRFVLIVAFRCVAAQQTAWSIDAEAQTANRTDSCVQFVCDQRRCSQRNCDASRFMPPKERCCWRRLSQATRPVLHRPLFWAGRAPLTLRDCLFCAVSGLRGSISLILAQAVVTEVPAAVNSTALVRVSLLQ